MMTARKTLLALHVVSFVKAYCADGWLEPFHVLFQLANAFFLFSYAAWPTIYGELFLRMCLTIGSILFVAWAWFIICAWDVVIWNAIFAVINAAYVVYIIWSLHPFLTFPPDVQTVYETLFKPLHVSKRSFRPIYKCIREIKVYQPFDQFW